MLYLDLFRTLDQHCFIAAAESLGLMPVAPVPLSALKDAEQRKTWIEQKHLIAFGLQNRGTGMPIMVDVLIAPSIDVELAFERAVTRLLGEVSVRIAAVKDMVHLKTGTGRPQDESDIEHLERLLGK